MKELDRVRLTQPIGRFPKGKAGTIIFVYAEDSFEVEFASPHGLATVTPDDIEPITHDDLATVLDDLVTRAEAGEVTELTGMSKAQRRKALWSAEAKELIDLADRAEAGECFEIPPDLTPAEMFKLLKGGDQ